MNDNKAITDNNEQQFSINYFGNKVVRQQCPLTGLKCCCERHICKAKKYQRGPCERIKAHLQPSALSIPKAPFDGESIHKTSYIPFDPPRPDSNHIKNLPPDGLRLNTGEFEKYTTHSSSFKKWESLPKTQRIVPCTRDILGPIHPFQNKTNYRDDFASQPFSKRPAFKIKSNLFCENKPIDDKTVSKLTYMPPKHFIPRKNLRPEDYFSKYCKIPMSISTTNKSDYVEYKIPIEKVDTSSWNSKLPYKKPKVQMDCTTLYKQSYLTLKPKSMEKIVSPCQTFGNTITDDKKFFDKSIYAADYPAKYVEPETIDKRAATRTSIHFGNDQFNGQSVHSLTFKPWNTKPSVPKKLDCRNTLRELGPMDLITTHKQDFTPKIYSKRPLEVLARLNSFEPVNKPFDCHTTSRLSYHSEKITNRPRIVKPKPVLCPSRDKFDGDTLYKKSFIPWPLSKIKNVNPESFTSFKIGAPFYGKTTYRNAFITPECIIEDDCEKPCGCTYPTQCLEVK